MTLQHPDPDDADPNQDNGPTKLEGGVEDGVAIDAVVAADASTGTEVTAGSEAAAGADVAADGDVAAGAGVATDSKAAAGADVAADSGVAAGPDVAAGLEAVAGPDVAVDLEATASAHRWRRWLRRAFQAVSIVTVLFFLPVSFVRLSTDTYVRSVSTVPAEPVGIVFGAEVFGDTPSAYLASRLDVAIALWKAHKIKVFLVSGDNSSPSYNEPKAMRDYLIGHGVPSTLIVLDYAGFDSWETCDRAKRVFGVNHAIVVSQSFHVPRAVFLCRSAGIEAYGVGDGDTGWTLGHAEYLRDESREVLAGMSAMYQAVFHPSPTFLGPQDTGITEALRAAG